MGTLASYKKAFEVKLLKYHGNNRFKLVKFMEIDKDKSFDRRVVLKCLKHYLDFEVCTKQLFLKPHGSCPECKIEYQCIKRYEKCKPLIDEYHGDKYIYQKPETFGIGGKLLVLCKEHGEFEKWTGDHLRAERPQGCPKCTPVETAFSYSQFISSCERNGNPTLYILRCFNESESFIKVGITGKGVKGRYRGPQAMPYGYEVINEYNGTPEEVWNLEKLIGSLFRQDFGYRPNIRFKGSMYECYKFE